MKTFNRLSTLIQEVSSLESETAPSGQFKSATNFYSAFHVSGVFSLFKNDCLILSYSRLPGYAQLIKIYNRPKNLQAILQNLSLPDYVIQAATHQDQIEFTEEANQNGYTDSSISSMGIPIPATRPKTESSNSISPNSILTIFYKALNQWIEEGCPFHNKYNFFKETGICDALDGYLKETAFNPEINYLLHKYLKASFISACLNPVYPFNPDSDCGPRFSYLQETNKYINPHRLAWIRDHLPKES